MGTDLTVVNSARVSFNVASDWEVDQARKDEAIDAGFDEEAATQGTQKLSDKDIKLIKYLAKHNHWTPFAHPQITLRIKAPISIRTQFFKHKQGFVENEMSKRYVSDLPDFYFPYWRTAPEDGAKQGSGEFIAHQPSDDVMGYYGELLTLSARMYGILISEYNIAPEQARFILPQGTLTEWYWTGSLAAYARFYKQRINPYAQWEIRVFAKTIGQILELLYPESWAALTADIDADVPPVPPRFI